MSEAVVTLLSRNKLMKARAGAIEFPKVYGFAFGDGGVNSAGEVIVPTESQTKLNNELFRKVIDGYEIMSDTECKYECTLLNDEMIGKSISEIALIDQDGDVIAIKNFKTKIKDSDMEMTFQITDKF